MQWLEFFEDVLSGAVLCLDASPGAAARWAESLVRVRVGRIATRWQLQLNKQHLKHTSAHNVHAHSIYLTTQHTQHMSTSLTQLRP